MSGEDQICSSEEAILKTSSQLRVISCLLLCVGLTGFASAQVNLPVSNLGMTTFEDGLAGPGGAIEEYIGYAPASSIRDSQGNKIAGANSTVNVFVTHLAYYTSYKFLGANVGTEVLAPLANVVLTQPQAGGTYQIRGAGDISISPIMMSWKPTNILGRLYFHRFHVTLTVPTGKYSDQRILNPGNHLVSLEPWYAFTIYPIKHSNKLEISGRLHYLWNSANEDPFVGYGFKNMQPGQALHENYTIGWLVKKDIRVGYNGYAVNQITKNRYNDVASIGSEERLFGNGPGVEIGSPDKITFFASFYVESGAHNTSEGTRLLFRVRKVFGPIGEH